jgi:hypothetical protein
MLGVSKPIQGNFLEEKTSKFKQRRERRIPQVQVGEKKVENISGRENKTLQDQGEGKKYTNIGTERSLVDQSRKGENTENQIIKCHMLWYQF